MHDDILLKKTSIAELLSTNESKTQIAAYLAKGLLWEFSDNINIELLVSYQGRVRINLPNTLDMGLQSHSHEEADTLIPLHILRTLNESTYKHIDVYSPVTDVLVLLLNLVSTGNISSFTNIILHAGKNLFQKLSTL